jgi:AcrR family transcriptional regulator
MAPPRKHDTDRILDAARTLVLREGPRAASVAAIAGESGAPAGTLYHRFGNRDGVLAAAWLRALERFQQSALAAAENPDALEAAVAMAVSQVGFARALPDDARLLLTLRRDDLLDTAPDEAFRARLEAINAPLGARLAELTQALSGRRTTRASEAITRAVVDLPNAVIRRWLHEDRALPSWLEADIATDARRLLSVAKPRQPRARARRPRSAP